MTAKPRSMTVDSPVNIGVVLLAAGGSSRLGRPKQLVKFQGKTLIRRAAEILLASDRSPVVVVLGAEIDITSRELDGLDLTICVNRDWSDGISSSIKAGLEAMLSKSPDVAAVVIALCDQPFVAAGDIDRLVSEYRTSGNSIVAAKYSGTLGVPALFAREMFEGLFALTGDEGARKLIRRHADQASAVEMEAAAIDIDTPEDIP